MSDIYDLAILGGGPAGITAAIYASRARLNTIWIDKNFAPGGQITATYEVDNYPGMPGISGMDLGEAFGEHARKLGLEPQREKILSLENISGDTSICLAGAEDDFDYEIEAGGGSIYFNGEEQRAFENSWKESHLNYHTGREVELSCASGTITVEYE